MSEPFTQDELDALRDLWLPDCTDEEIDAFRVRALVTIDVLGAKLEEARRAAGQWRDLWSSRERVCKEDHNQDK